MLLTVMSIATTFNYLLFVTIATVIGILNLVMVAKGKVFMGSFCCFYFGFSQCSFIIGLDLRMLIQIIILT